MFSEIFLAPFAEFAFMRRALVAALALSLGCAPVGVFLLLRRMSLVGDAMSHAILPGVAIGYLLGGLSVPAMSVGGFVAGLATAATAGWVARATAKREDASFAAFYLIALAGGVLIVSTRGSSVDLMHVLFGSVLAVDDAALLTVAATATVSMIVVAIMLRALVVASFDPGFLQAMGGPVGRVHAVFVVLVVVNLVAAFQAMGTLMAVGLMMLPAAAARYWARDVASMIALAVLNAALAGYLGLVLSFALELPSGPSIVLVAGALYVASVLVGREGGLLAPSIARYRLES